MCVVRVSPLGRRMLRAWGQRWLPSCPVGAAISLLSVSRVPHPLSLFVHTALLVPHAVCVSRAAMEEGADVVKTSTGRRGPADVVAVAIMASEVAAHLAVTGRVVGVKVSGGVSTVADAQAREVFSAVCV